MTATSTLPFAQPQRYMVYGRHVIRVSVTRAGSAAPDEGTLVDLAENEASLDLRSRFEIGERVNLELASDDGTWQWETSAAIVRTRPDRTLDRWLTRCQFDRPLESSVLERLTDARLLERRRSTRVGAPIAGVARWENMREPCEIQMIDLGAGGFRFSSPVEGSEGALVQVQIRDPQYACVFDGRICWSKPATDGFTIGCRFTSAPPAEAERLILQFDAGTEHAAPGNSIGKRLGGVLARFFRRTPRS